MLESFSREHLVQANGIKVEMFSIEGDSRQLKKTFIAQTHRKGSVESTDVPKTTLVAGAIGSRLDGRRRRG
ncbi:MAG: hypothetical protein DMG96_36230 [Acidobacteria bacterium]|nr:MAG: hypothetical protein DMG96_36230 [Acidobacteriota bacterium]